MYSSTFKVSKAHCNVITLTSSSSHFQVWKKSPTHSSDCSCTVLIRSSLYPAPCEFSWDSAPVQLYCLLLFDHINETFNVDDCHRDSQVPVVTGACDLGLWVILWYLFICGFMCLHVGWVFVLKKKKNLPNDLHPLMFVLWNFMELSDSAFIHFVWLSSVHFLSFRSSSLWSCPWMWCD